MDAEGNVLLVRDELSFGTKTALRRLKHPPGSTQEDRWQRTGEALFERLVVSWEIAGLPLTAQKELLGRYRMADPATRSWVRATLLAHVRARAPDLDL